MPRHLLEVGGSMVRLSIRRLHDGRDRCADCGRTPLVGEHVHVYEGDALVCELCRPEREGAALRIEAVRHPELGQAVKPATRVAA